MKNSLGAITKTSASALALAMGLSIGTAYAGEFVFDPVPGEHGGSAGFTDLSAFAASNNEDKVASILSNNTSVDGIVTLDRARNLTTEVDVDAFPAANGTLAGITTLVVRNANGSVALVREVPITAGGHRFREAWVRDYRSMPSSLDGNLRRGVGHALAIRAVENRSGTVIRGVTDPAERIVDSRFDISSWIGIVQTKITDLANDASPDIPGRVTGGTSRLVFFGPRDEAQWWDVHDSTVTAVNRDTVHADATFFSPYDNDASAARGASGGSTGAGNEVFIRVAPYNTARRNPLGRYIVLYRGNFGGNLSALRQAGWLVATGGEINSAIADDNLSTLLFGNDDADIDGTVFDQDFITVSPAARTRIKSVRNPSDLLRPDAPSN